MCVGEVFNLIEGRVEITHTSLCFGLHAACSDFQNTVCGGMRVWCVEVRCVGGVWCEGWVRMVCVGVRMCVKPKHSFAD